MAPAGQIAAKSIPDFCDLSLACSADRLLQQAGLAAAAAAAAAATAAAATAALAVHDIEKFCIAAALHKVWSLLVAGRMLWFWLHAV